MLPIRSLALVSLLPLLATQPLAAQARRAPAASPKAVPGAAPRGAATPARTKVAGAWRGEPLMTLAGSDSIYRLAVDAKDFPDDQTLLLLDDGVVRYEADGRGTRSFRQIRQILKREAIENASEPSWGYLPERERFVLNWARVVRPDGSVISARPALVQDADVPADRSSPVFQKQKLYRVSLSGVTEGSLIDISWSYIVTDPMRKGDLLEGWRVHAGAEVKRSRYVVDAPAEMPLRIKALNVTFPVVDTVMKGRRIRTWARNDVPKVDNEPFASDSNGIVATISVGGTGTWEDIGNWYAGLAKGRDTLTPAVITKLRALVKDAKTQDDSIKAIHRWVAQDVRYVSVALGQGGYQPRTPQMVLETGFGDCKDKATIFMAALRWMGIPAWTVLINALGEPDTTLPSKNAFNHAITALDRGHGYEYADMTAELVPFGSIPPNLEGQFGLVVRGNGRIDRVILPESKPEENLRLERIAGTLSPTGQLAVAVTQEAHGSSKLRMRAEYADKVDAKVMDQAARAAAQSYFTNATADSLLIAEGRNLSVEPRFALYLKAPQAARKVGASYTLPVRPASRGRVFNNLADRLDSKRPRLLPIDLRPLVGTAATRNEFVIEVPEGWRAELPPEIHASFPALGRYDVTYRQEGRRVTVVRAVTPVEHPGVIPPEALDDVIRFLREAGKDDTDDLILTPAR